MQKKERVKGIRAQHGFHMWIAAIKFYLVVGKTSFSNLYVTLLFLSASDEIKTTQHASHCAHLPEQ